MPRILDKDDRGQLQTNEKLNELREGMMFVLGTLLLQIKTNIGRICWMSPTPTERQTCSKKSEMIREFCIVTAKWSIDGRRVD
jgi:hypothetical protein